MALMRWTDLPLRAKGLVVIAIPSSAILLMAIAAFVVGIRERESELQILHTMEVRSQIQALLVNLVDAETGVGGYLLTNRHEFLDPYEAAGRDLVPTINTLEHLLSDPEARLRHDRIRALVFERRHLLLKALAAGRDSTELHGLLTEGKRAMDALRTALGENLQTEDRLLQAAMTRRDVLHRRHRWLLTACLAFGIAGGVTAGMLFTSGVMRRMQLLEQSAQELAEGRPLASADTVPADEIGSLDRALRKASALQLNRERTIRDAATEIADLYEHAPCGYHSLAGDGIVARMNHTELEWLQYRREEVVGRLLFRDLVTAESRPRFEADFDRFLHGGHVSSLEVDLVRKDGTVLPVSVTSTAIRDAAGTVVGSRSSVFDIADRRAAEASIRELNEELQRRLNDQHALNRELEAFSYSVSHDLRAPLRSIDGFAQALVEDYADRLDGTGRNFLSRVRNAAQRMGRLIDDMLGLSRVTRAELNARDVDLSAIARDIAERLQEQSPGRAVDWRIDEDLHAFGDAQLLRIVLDNLLSNAWKFTSRTEAPAIAFTRATIDGHPAFAVRDNGAGFDMAYADKLFGAFQRLHSATEYPGTGIGLATVQRVIHKHGGVVRASGAPNQGAEFVFSLGNLPDVPSDAGSLASSA
jgi:PAS domain S-box-containing protein